MFWSLRSKYTLQVCTHLPLQCFCQIKTIFVSSFKPKESREFRVFQAENANKLYGNLSDGVCYFFIHWISSMKQVFN